MGERWDETRNVQPESAQVRAKAASSALLTQSLFMRSAPPHPTHPSPGGERVDASVVERRPKGLRGPGWRPGIRFPMLAGG